MEKLTSLLKNVDEFTGFARKRLGDPELAADAVQESLLKALKAADQIRDEENAKAWFYRILRRTIIDLYRRRDARDRALSGLERELTSLPDKEEEVVVCACMERLLPGMTTQYAGLIQKVDLNEEPPDSVAESLGISRSNLNVRLYRARQQLKRRLEENCRVCAKHGCLDCHCGSEAKRPG
ncbi:MAG TPA: sigma-70 family RNA polymerase sigma factor [Gammaproteobacteria bacterium]|nr:sigma-70 family RNA polymerase sigma factor [Gammaproteobacteria bacterium]